MVTTAALTVIWNNIPGVSNLVKKTDYDTKFCELVKTLTDYNHDKYITTPNFNKLKAENFDARLAQPNLKTKIDFHAKLSSLNRKNKTKHLLIENKFKKLKTFDSIYFCGKSQHKKTRKNYI